MKRACRQLFQVAAGVLALASVGSAWAAGGAGFQIFGGDFSWNGFVRQEDAFNTSRNGQEVNQFGDPVDGIPVPRAAGNPFINYAAPIDPTGVSSCNGVTGTVLGNVPLLGLCQGLTGPTGGLQQIQASLTKSNTTALGSNQISPLLGVSDVFTRYIPRRTPEMNYHVLRLELSSNIKWGEFELQARLRTLFDPGNLGYREFNAADYANVNSGTTGGVPRQFFGKPDNFGYDVDGNHRNPLYFERSGRNYFVDLPAFFLQWSHGDYTVRVGNQSVAWGQLLFFRIMDVANGLDLRRHLFLGRALEEYADQRESAPGIRFTWQATDQIVVDSFAQQFIPTILTSVNTPYNVIPTQFTLHDKYYDQGAYHKFNIGARIKAEFGNYNFQAMFTHRYNQLGAIRWAHSGVDKPLANDNALGAAFNGACESLLIPEYNTTHGTNYETTNGCGPLLAQTAFETSGTGVQTAEEWFNYAGYIKLNALEGLNKAVDDFPAAQQIFAQDIGHDVNKANNELNAFFIASDGLRGHIERYYFSENIIGLGGGYVTEGEPGSLLDQLIINFEGTYTPHRMFTATNLQQQFYQTNEVQAGIVMEKYQRFFTSIPATYMVFQALHQKTADLAGLLIKGYGSENFSMTNIKLNPHVPTSSNPSDVKIDPKLTGGANYVVLAALQPTNAYIYEFSFATLIDIRGGLLFQPALQWKPRGDMTVNVFYNYVNGHLWDGNTNKNIVSLLENDDEFNLRIAYQF